MDAISTRLSKLSVKNARRQNRGSQRRNPPSGVTSPSGLRTPASGLATPQHGSSSGLATPQNESEAYSDDEEDEHEENVRQPFRFFELPYELRRKILLNVMQYNDVVDLNVNAVRRLGMMPVSKQWYHEACEAFYGGNFFRLLPLDGQLFKKRTKPLIQHFTSRNRGYVTRLELRLGPHWGRIPPCWQLEDKVGLEDLTAVRRLDVFVQCDPEHPSFVGFRKSKDFYTNFCGDLLNDVFKRIPKLESVAFDSWPSVGRDSPLLQRLEMESASAGKKVLWSSTLRLDDCYETVYPSDVPTIYDTVPIRQMDMTHHELSALASLSA